MASYKAAQLDARNIGSIINFTSDEESEVFGRLDMIEKHADGMVELRLTASDDIFELPEDQLVTVQRPASDSYVVHLKSAIEALSDDLATPARPQLMAVSA